MTQQIPTTIEVEIVISAGEREVSCQTLSLPLGSTVMDALHAAQINTAAAPSVGVWGRLRPLHGLLEAGDRLEVYRPLTVDPMEARRRRHAHQKRVKLRQSQAERKAP